MWPNMPPGMTRRARARSFWSAVSALMFIAGSSDPLIVLYMIYRSSFAGASALGFFHRGLALGRTAEAELRHAVGAFDDPRFAGFEFGHQLHQPRAALDHVVLHRLASGDRIARPKRLHQREMLVLAGIGRRRIGIKIFQQWPVAQ